MRFSPFCTLLALLTTLNVVASTPTYEDNDIICHETDCYPRIFQATDEFQIVKEDQIIPKGLHVRMDFNTGLKEAKLYDGHDDASLQAVEVFQDETIPPEAIPSPPEGLEFLQSDSQKVLKPEKVDQGAIRPPPTGPDGAGFARNTETILSATTDTDALLPALENLEDLSHDIYWGLRLGQDGKVVHKLNTFIGTNGLDYRIRSAAALLLGTAIQNNPAALTAALSHFYNDSHPDGPLETVMLALIHEQIPALTIRLVYLISELCQDQAQLLSFIRGDGLEILRTLYNGNNTNTDTTDRLRQKISNFVLDHFLREDSLQGLTKTTGVHPGAHRRKTSIEDTWTIIDKSDIPSTQQSKDRLNMRRSLSQWCEPFSASLKSWETSIRSGERETAREHVLEASSALDAKLKTFGCSCGKIEKCQK